jgi:hypothetical protein
MWYESTEVNYLNMPYGNVLQVGFTVVQLIDTGKTYIHVHVHVADGV